MFHLFPPPKITAGGGTDTVGLYRTANPPGLNGLYMPYNGWLTGVTPAPPAGSHDHFDLIKDDPRAVGSWDLRSEQSIEDQSQTPDYAEVWSYDTGYDAALLNFSTSFSEGLTLSANRQLWFDFPFVNVAAGNTFSFQYEIMYDSQWGDLTPVPAFSGIQKTIRFDHPNTTAIDERSFEMNNECPPEIRDYAALPRVRSYIMPRDPLAISNPPYDDQRADETLSIDHSAVARLYPIALQNWDDEGTGPVQTTDQDRQPSIDTSLDKQRTNQFSDADHQLMAGGDVNQPFLHRFNLWARITVSWQYEAPGVLRFKVEGSDEQTDPVALISHKDTALGFEGRGLNTWNSGTVEYPAIPGTGLGKSGDYAIDNGCSRVRAEFNSSGGGTPPGADFKIWIRNFVAWSSNDGSIIPHGGRPEKTGTIT